VTGLVVRMDGEGALEKLLEGKLEGGRKDKMEDLD
jgi:hypothetical protein